MNANAIKSFQTGTELTLSKLYACLASLRYLLSSLRVSFSPLLFLTIKLHLFLTIQLLLVALTLNGSQGWKRFTFPIKRRPCAYLLEVFQSVPYLFRVRLCVMHDRLRFGWSFPTTPTLQHLTQPEGAKNCGESLKEREKDREEAAKRKMKRQAQHVRRQGSCGFSLYLCTLCQNTWIQLSACVCNACVPSFVSHGRCETTLHNNFAGLCARAPIKRWFCLHMCNLTVCRSHFNPVESKGVERKTWWWW